ncbi:MAG: AEC family transporter [Acidobacteria bacterium]|nr:MAG: AEC family transporter [Acidobacteriota bacterium]
MSPTSYRTAPPRDRWRTELVYHSVLEILANDILPVFLIASAGFLVARFAKADVVTLTRVAFFVLLPCLVFNLILTSPMTGGDIGRLVAAAVLVIAVMGTVAFTLSKLLGLDQRARAAFMLVVMFSNGGNFGLPLVSFAFGAQALAHASVFFLVGAVLTFVLGSYIAAAGQRSPAAALVGVLKMPIIYAAGAALLVKYSGVTLPTLAVRPIGLLSGAALPLMMLILGMQLERAKFPKRVVPLAVGIGTSLVVSPIVALLLCSWLGIDGPARQAAVTLSAMPVAVSTTILALEFEVEPDFVTGAVFLSTILSPLTLAPLIAYLR